MSIPRDLGPAPSFPSDDHPLIRAVLAAPDAQLTSATASVGASTGPHIAILRSFTNRSVKAAFQSTLGLRRPAATAKS